MKGNRFAALAVLLVLLLFGSVLRASAAEHVVSAAELHRSVAQASEARTRDVNKIRAFLREDRVQTVLKTARINQQKIVNAVPVLSDAELARLAQATDKAQKDFAAGSLTNEQLTYIVIALATAVIVILIVEH